MLHILHPDVLEEVDQINRRRVRQLILREAELANRVLVFFYGAQKFLESDIGDLVLIELYRADLLLVG